MNLQIKSYNQQLSQWPGSGRHILAQFDDHSVVVYQAYRPAIGLFAAANGFFGGKFSYSRMSWIKPNFLWMMYRSDWGTKTGQEITLAIRLKRHFFDTILRTAVPSSFSSQLYHSKEDWKKAVVQSDVRLQWDPDHNPRGDKEARRAIQLGLRRTILAGFKGEGIISIENISDFVAGQRQNIKNSKYAGLSTPVEKIYPVEDFETRQRLGLDMP